MEAAKRVGAAAEAEANKRGATVVIVVVDDGGSVLWLERLNDTQVASVDVGIGKARTAAIFRRPSKVFEDQIRDGRVAALALPGATPLAGRHSADRRRATWSARSASVAIRRKRTRTSPRQERQAFAALIAGESQPGVSYWKSQDVTAAFAKGSVLFGGEDGRNYMVHASHRDGAGMAEVHTLDADIIYVLDGSATFVTGGTVEGGRRQPLRMRSAARRSPTARFVASPKGDVLIVPEWHAALVQGRHRSAELLRRQGSVREVTS